jgi:hypothetical protein
MANNTTLNTGAGGDVIRDVDRTGVKTQVVGIDIGIGSGTESLMTTSNGMPVVLLAGAAVIGAIKKAPSTTGTITSVTSAASSTQLLASNSSRLGATFYNESTAVLYLALAGSASVTAYTVQVPAGGYYELPNDGCGYTGSVFGIWAAANGACRVTELT